MRNTKIKWITEFGVLLALFYVLDFISRLLPTITMVNGSVALSAVPTLMVFVGIKYGPLKGLLFGMMAPMTLYIGIYPPFFENPAQFLLDYSLALGGVCMVSGLVYRTVPSKSVYLKVGISAALAFSWQYISYFIALTTYLPGGYFAGNAYMIPFILFNIPVATLLIPRMQKALKTTA